MSQKIEEVRMASPLQLDGSATNRKGHNKILMFLGREHRILNTQGNTVGNH